MDQLKYLIQNQVLAHPMELCHFYAKLNEILEYEIFQYHNIKYKPKEELEISRYVQLEMIHVANN